MRLSFTSCQCLTHLQPQVAWGGQFSDKNLTSFIAWAQRTLATLFMGLFVYRTETWVPAGSLKHPLNLWALYEFVRADGQIDSHRNKP